MTTRSPRRPASKRSDDKGAGLDLLLRLYVAGESPNSLLAIANLRAAIAHLSKDDVTLELIDVLREPERSLRDGVLVTPTLVKAAPAPEQRMIGNLRDRADLLCRLGITRGAP